MCIVFSQWISTTCCSDLGVEDSTPAPKRVDETLVIKEIKKIDTDNEIYQKFLSSETFKVIKSNVEDLNVVDIQLVTFPIKGAGGLIVTISPRNGYQRDIMVIYNKTLSNEFIALLREHNVRIENNRANGETNWFTPDHEKLNELKVVNNRITDFKTYDPDIKLKSSKVLDYRATWICTNTQFNRHYQNAKNRCENEWWCDFGCNFEPCGISYLAYAVIQCTRWVDCDYVIRVPPIDPWNSPYGPDDEE